MRLLPCLVFLAVSLAFYPALAAKHLTIDDVRDMPFS
jgi:hypothetical protein